MYAERRWMPLKADTITEDYIKDADGAVVHVQKFRDV